MNVLTRILARAEESLGQEVLQALCLASLSIPDPIPVILPPVRNVPNLIAYKGKLLPAIGGAGFTSYDDLITELTAGKSIPNIFWAKQHGTVAGVANSWESFWTRAGFPPAGAYSGTALAFQQNNDGITGGILHGGNVSPDTKHLLSLSGMTTAATGIPGILLLIDRLGYYPTINAAITSAQTLTNAAAIQRYTTGARVMMWMEVTTALGTGTGVVTIAYTDDAGNAFGAFGAVVNTVASSIVGRIPHAGTAVNTQHAPFLALAAGDKGVRSVQTITFTTAHSAGVVALNLCVPFAMIPITTVNVLSERDTVLQVANLEQVYDGACLNFLYYHAGALVASTPYMGHVGVAWG
jgi:hypothetical protein